jgi:phage baseplate assembly protein W
MIENFKGYRYPLLKDPRGIFWPASGVNQIKGDLLTLILTNFNERVMLTDYGMGLNDFLFEQANNDLISSVRQRIASKLEQFEPRITINAIDISYNPQNSLNPSDDMAQNGQILFIRIQFIDPENITEVQELRLELPLGGGTGS